MSSYSSAGDATSKNQNITNTCLTNIDNKTPALGQAVMTVSSPVVIASDQSPIPTTVSSFPLPSGASTSDLQTIGNNSLNSIDSKTPALGQALAAASTPIVLTAAQLTTLTPFSSVTANAGSNLNTSSLALESGGNLATVASKDFATQATLAQVKIDTDKIPSQGQALSASSTPVVLASDQSTVSVKQNQTFEGQDFVSLLGQILIELKLHTYYLYTLNSNQVNSRLDEPQTLRSDTTFFN